MKKVIFTSLGPNKTFSTIAMEFADGDVATLCESDYEQAVIISKFAQDHTDELEIKTKRLVAVSEKKRKEIMEKMARLKK